MTSKTISDVTICVATIGRPECLVRLVQSIRRYYPDIRILVGEQTEDGLNSRLRSVDAEVHCVPHDFGVSATRNALVSLVRTKYFLLCDDDFIFGPRTDIAVARKILDANQSVGIVGGLLYDLHGTDELREDHPRNWERFLHLDQKGRRLLLTPLQRAVPRPQSSSGNLYFRCDSVLNWALMRSSLFHSGRLGWDPQFKIAGEHEDFYLSIKVNQPDVGIIYCPTMVAYHHHTAAENDAYQSLRGRLSGWGNFRDKWGVDEVVDENHFGSYIIDTVKLTAKSHQIDHHSFLARSLEASGRRNVAWNAIGIDSDGSIYRTSDVTSGGGSLFLNRAAGKLIGAAERNQAETSRNEGHLVELLRTKEAELQAVLNSTTWRAFSVLRQRLEEFPAIRKIARRSIKLIWWTISLQLLSRVRQRYSR